LSGKADNGPVTLVKALSFGVMSVFHQPVVAFYLAALIGVLLAADGAVTRHYLKPDPTAAGPSLTGLILWMALLILVAAAVNVIWIRTTVLGHAKALAGGPRALLGRCLAVAWHQLGGAGLYIMTLVPVVGIVAFMANILPAGIQPLLLAIAISILPLVLIMTAVAVSVIGASLDQKIRLRRAWRLSQPCRWLVAGCLFLPSLAAWPFSWAARGLIGALAGMLPEPATPLVYLASAGAGGFIGGLALLVGLAGVTLPARKILSLAMAADLPDDGDDIAGDDSTP